ncbi:MAG: muramidase [Aeromonadaceae bacterium]
MLPFLADIPPQEQERVVCSISAAVKYDTPANIVLAIAEKEGGKPGQRVRNTNGTDDVGAMQFNTDYLKDLAKYGITANDVAGHGCYPFELAAWRIRMHIKNDSGDIWTKAANYHSKTPGKNRIYRADLIKKAVKWAEWLESRFVTIDVMQKEVTPKPILKPSNMRVATSSPQQNVAVASSSKEINSKKQEKNNSSGYIPRMITFTPSDSRAK